MQKQWTVHVSIVFDGILLELHTWLGVKLVTVRGSIWAKVPPTKMASRSNGACIFEWSGVSVKAVS